MRHLAGAGKSAKQKWQTNQLGHRRDCPKPDPVFYLAGGPGQAAREVYPQIANAFRDILRERDVILVDQRGTGGSAALQCKDESVVLADVPDDGVEAVKNATLNCLKSLKADVQFYSTLEAIEDLEAVRKAVGAVQVNLIGGSYGTRVAQTYLRYHPTSIRTVVIDGVVPQEMALGGEHGSNLDSALKANLARCNHDKACAARFGDVWATVQKMRAQYKSTPSKVMVDDPTTGKPVEKSLNGGTFAGLLRLYAYAPETVSLLPITIDEAARGRPQSLINQTSMLTSSLIEGMSQGMSSTVICTEDFPFAGKPGPAETDTLMGTEIYDGYQTICPLWPHHAVPADFKQPMKTDKPILLLSGEFDPVTPPRYAEQAMRGMSNSKHIVVKFQGHQVMFRGCMPKILAAFIDTASVQKLETTCLSELHPLPFFLDLTGPAP
jgi:pimeloyl-ACP methyl ester carboxylesterase